MGIVGGDLGLGNVDCRSVLHFVVVGLGDLASCTDCK